MFQHASGCMYNTRWEPWKPVLHNWRGFVDPVLARGFHSTEYVLVCFGHFRLSSGRFGRLKSFVEPSAINKLLPCGAVGQQSMSNIRKGLFQPLRI